MSGPVEPCPTCPEGWRPMDKEHCADCYEGQIERLRVQLARVTEAQNWLDERSRNSKSFGHHAFAYEVAARKLREAME